MANTLITPSVVAKLAYGNLYDNAVMAQLVHRDYSADFAGNVGDTVTIRKPATFTAEEFNGTAISVQDATETSTTVVLNKHLDVSFAVTSADLTLEVADFNSQFVVPAVEALRQKVDELLLGLRTDVTQTVGEIGGGGLGEWDDPKVLIDAARELNQAKVPQTERYVVAGPVTSASWLADALFHQADQRGDTDGLREASLGRKFGFDSYMSQNITDAGAEGAGGGTESSVAFHRTAFALVTRTLALPQGIGEGQGAVFGDQGIGIRVVRDYDVSAKKDIISLDFLCGVKTLDATRACLIVDADGS